MKRNIQFGRPIIGESEIKKVLEILGQDILVHGPVSKEFEASFASFVGCEEAVSVSSCTAGLHLFYFVNRVGPGDEVIVPAQTHTATVHAVELVGATPVFIDAELETGNINIDLIEEKITDRTKAISVVHYLGMPVDMRRIKELAIKHNLLVIEDCALGIGSKVDGVHVGNFGDAGSFSFYPVKHMTTAEGGMLICNNKDLANRFRLQRAFGVDRTASERTIPGEYDVVALGFNYRMSEVHAALGVEQVKRLSWILERREKNYQYLENRLGEIEHLQLFRSSNPRLKSSYYCLSVLLDEILVRKRFEIIKGLREKGIGTSIYYPKPVPHFTYYINKYKFLPDSFPISSRISYGSIALPVGPHLDEEDMEYIYRGIKEVIYDVK